MASKKGKKSKGVTMSMAEFVSQVEEKTGAPSAGLGQNVVYSDKKKSIPTMSSWADEEDEDASFYEKERIILPSAPRAARGPAYDDSEIPREPPFTAHLGNLPYDIDEEEIYKFFKDLDLAELKLPRDQQTNRLRGFGYADFESRAGLIEALTRNEQMMRGRPVRITLGTGQNDRRGGGGDMDRGGMRDDRRRRPPAEDDDVDDWRSMMKAGGDDGPEPDFRRGPPSGDYNSMPRGGYNNRDRGFDRGGGMDRRPRGPPQDEDMDFSRSSMMQGPPPPGPGQYNTYGGRGNNNRGYGSRDREYGGYESRERNYDRDYQRPPQYSQQQQHHSRHHSESSDQGNQETWRRGPPPPAPREHTTSVSSQSSQQYDRSFERDNIRDRGNSPSERSRHEYEQDDEPVRQAPKERKRLVLQPRTVDKPVGDSEVGSSSIFGGAKPVDTTKREREIEEKLEKLKVDDEPAATGQEETAQEEQEQSNERERPRGPREHDRDSRERSDRSEDRNERPKYRLLTRGSGSREAFIELEPASSSTSVASRSSRGGPMRAPPPLPLSGSFSRDRFSSLRSDDNRGGSYRGRGGPRGMDRDRSDRGMDRPRGDMDRPRGDMDRPRGDMDRRGGDMDRPRGDMDRPRGERGDMDRRGGDMDRRGGDMDRPRGDMDRQRGDMGRGDRYGRGGPRDHDSQQRRMYDRDHGPPSRGPPRQNYDRPSYNTRDEGQSDFRRGPPHQSNNNTSSIGSASEERDRDSHSEPEDDRDMIRSGGGGGHEKAAPQQRSEFSDEDSEFTRVERRGRKSYNNRGNNNAATAPVGQGSRGPVRGGNNDRW